MVRGSMLAAIGAWALLSAMTVAPRAGAESLAVKLGLVAAPADADAAAATPMMRDPNVRPAAVAAREQAMQGTSRRGGGGGSLFPKLRMPSLFGGSRGEAPLDEPPAAYDAPGAGGATTNRRAVVGTVTPARRQGVTAGATRGAAGAGTTATRPAVGGTTQPRTTTQPQTATPRVARSSPPTSSRHNELADALTGLRDMPETNDAEAGDANIAPPEATGEAAPSYLDNGAGDAGAEPTDGDGTSSASGARGWSRGPVDVRDALLGEDTTDAGRAAPAVAPRRAPVAAPVRRAAPQAAAPVRRSPPRTPVAETDIAAELQGDVSGDDSLQPQAEEESLGAISAEPTPPTYEAAAPVAPRTQNQATTPFAGGGSETIVNRRPTAGLPKPLDRLSSDVLLSCRPPVIVSNVTGPQRVVVGRPVEYRIELANKGEGLARDVSATITVPASAEVLDAAASGGAIEQDATVADGAPRTIKWQLYELTAGGSQTLTLKLSPRGGQPLQLSVACTQAPTLAEALVEVQEPKLQMEIAGPSEVLFGKSQRYTLTLSNPGTGSAEEVVIELTPPGGDPKSPVRHKVGTLAAGASKSIELELTAREAGDLKMLAAATAVGELRTETLKTVLCRRPKLDVDWRGPEQNFAGAVATYYLRVRNPGTAPAEQVGVMLTLPAGAEMVDASTGHAWDATRRTVTWQPGSLAASEERFMQVRCRLSKPGVNQLELVAHTAAGDLSDVLSVPITVEALADLKLAVSDPEGVLPVGESAVYEIHVQNRGQTAAHGVNVIAMFSEGIEPSHVEGGQHEIRDGRVSFRTIDALPAGAEVVLRIHAKATSAGTHVFRTEVVCDDLETKLVAEETTRYFVEEERWADASAAYSEQAEGGTR